MDEAAFTLDAAYAVDFGGATAEVAQLDIQSGNVSLELQGGALLVQDGTRIAPLAGSDLVARIAGGTLRTGTDVFSAPLVIGGPDGTTTQLTIDGAYVENPCQSVSISNATVVVNGSGVADVCSTFVSMDDSSIIRLIGSSWRAQGFYGGRMELSSGASINNADFLQPRELIVDDSSIRVFYSLKAESIFVANGATVVGPDAPSAIDYMEISDDQSRFDGYEVNGEALLVTDGGMLELKGRANVESLFITAGGKVVCDGIVAAVLEVLEVGSQVSMQVPMQIKPGGSVRVAEGAFVDVVDQAKLGVGVVAEFENLALAIEPPSNPDFVGARIRSLSIDVSDQVSPFIAVPGHVSISECSSLRIGVGVSPPAIGDSFVVMTWGSKSGWFYNNCGYLGAIETAFDHPNGARRFNLIAFSDRLEAEVLLQGDVDGDLVVTGADLGLLLGAWGTDLDSADLNDDLTVDARDLGLLLGNWGGTQ